MAPAGDPKGMGRAALVVVDYYNKTEDWLDPTVGAYMTRWYDAAKVVLMSLSEGR